MKINELIKIKTKFQIIITTIRSKISIAKLIK